MLMVCPIICFLRRSVEKICIKGSVRKKTGITDRDFEQRLTIVKSAS